MERGEEILNRMIALQRLGPIPFVLHASGRAIQLSDSRVVAVRSQVIRPTRNGDEYLSCTHWKDEHAADRRERTRCNESLSETHLYKVIGSSKDLGIAQLLSGMMLGPSTEFARLKLTARLPPPSNEMIAMYGHVTNSMQNSSLIHLHIVIDQVE